MSRMRPWKGIGSGVLPSLTTSSTCCFNYHKINLWKGRTTTNCFSNYWRNVATTTIHYVICTRGLIWKKHSKIIFFQITKPHSKPCVKCMGSNNAIRSHTHPFKPLLFRCFKKQNLKLFLISLLKKNIKNL
jgi:hypothetical protein